MAFVADQNNKLIDPNQQQQGQMQSQQPGATAPASDDGSSGIVTGGGSGSQTPTQNGAAGGNGSGWTNIQSYMQANQGDTGGSKLLQDKVGGQLQAENDQLQKSASQAKGQADEQANNMSGIQSNAAQMIGSAPTQYDWNNQSDAYKQSVGKVHDALSAKYSGPTGYSYGLSAPAQQYKTDLGNDGGFNQMMGNLYQERAGGQMNQGQRNLQSQLDVSNQALGDTRQSLLGQYAGFGGQTIKDTNDAIQKDKDAFGTSQSALRDYLNNQKGTLDTSIGGLEGKARADYGADMGKQSGHGSTVTSADLLGGAGNLLTINPLNGGGAGAAEAPDITERRNLGFYGPNLTWSQLGKDVDYFKNNPTQHSTNEGYWNQFNAGEDAKYANTADTEKRQWNMIQDMLGSSDPRKTQGFNFRG